MALFKRFFFRKPPDGLLEISERVYVFDHCFSTEVLREGEYKEYMGGIVTQIQSHFPDASFMVFNFWDGESESQISSILSDFDMTVMDYPRHYEGCPLLKMEMVHHFLRSCESWLCLGQQNFLLMHCERGGWPVMAFMLAALLIYLKEYTGEQRTLDMIYKQAPHELLQFLSPLNPVPSQLRYLQYVSRSVTSEWPPLDRALTLDCIILRMIPIFDSLGGCRPIFRIYGQDPFFLSDKTTKVLFSTPKKSKLVRHYKQADCELVKLDIGCHIQGDIVIECISLDEDLEREAMMFRVVLNTAFIRSNILMLNRDQIDILWDAKDRFPKGFRAEVLLSEMDSGSSLATMEVSHVEDKEGLPMEAFAKVHEIFSHLDWLEGKGDAALHIIQKISACNSSKEKLDEVPRQIVQSSNPLDSGFDILSKKIHFDGKKNLATSEISGPELPESSELLLHSSPLSTPRPLLPSLPPPLELLKTVSPSSTGSDEHVMQSAMLQHPLPPPPPPPPLPPSPQLPFSTSIKQNILITQSHITRAPASINIMPPPLPPPLPPTPPPPPPPKLTPQRANQTILAPSLSFSNPTPLSETAQSSDLPSTKSVSSIHIPSSRRQPVSEKSSDIGNNISTEHRQPLGRTESSAPPPPPPPPRSAILSSPPPVIPSSPLLPPSPPHPPPSPMKKTRMASTPPPPPPLPHHMLKQSDAPSLLTPALSSSSSALRTSQSNSTQFVPPPPIAALSPLNSMSSSNKGKSLTRTKSSRSLHSTQSSSRRTSLKPLHWVKVTRAMSGSLWAETQKSDELSKTLEIDMLELESLFSAGVPNSDASGLAEKLKHRSSLGGKSEKVHLIDLRRANNCEIMLTKVKVPIPDLMSLVLALDDSILDVDQVDNLIKFCPTKEEMELLQGYKGDKESLGKCEKFFLELMKVPRVESKLRVFSFKLQFHIQVNDLRSNLNTINSATDEIRSSVKLKRVMQTILSLGNALNQGTARGSAIGFRLDSLLKLSDTRARNNKMTLMHYLCKVLADKLPEVLDFHKDLVSLEAASKIQLKIMAEEMQAVTKGLEKVEEELTSSESDGLVSKTFRETLKAFLVIAEAEVRSLTSLYTGVGRNADALARYFGEDPTRCSFEQVVSTLFNFIRMFERAHEENCKQLELERKKAQKEAEQEKLRLALQKKESEHVFQSPNRSGNSKR